MINSRNNSSQHTSATMRKKKVVLSLFLLPYLLSYKADISFKVAPSSNLVDERERSLPRTNPSHKGSFPPCIEELQAQATSRDGVETAGKTPIWEVTCTSTSNNVRRAGLAFKTGPQTHSGSSYMKVNMAEPPISLCNDSF